MNAPVPHPGALDLSGAWRLESVDGRMSAAISLPGDVHSALIAAGLIADPYVGRNELDVRWVADADWRLSRDFDHPGPEATAWYLDIDGIDTVADVTLNGSSCCRPATLSPLPPGRDRSASAGAQYDLRS